MLVQTAFSPDEKIKELSSVAVPERLVVIEGMPMTVHSAGV